MKLKILLPLACALAVAGGATESRAEIQSGMAGHGWPNHFDGCFGSSWSAMVNNCGGSPGGQRLLIIPFQIHQVGWYNTVTARAAGNGSDTRTTCQAISVQALTQGQYAYSATQAVSTDTTTNMNQLNLGALFVQYTATVHVECSVAQGGGRVNNIELN